MTGRWRPWRSGAKSQHTAAIGPKLALACRIAVIASEVFDCVPHRLCARGNPRPQATFRAIISQVPVMRIVLAHVRLVSALPSRRERPVRRGRRRQRFGDLRRKSERASSNSGQALKNRSEVVEQSAVALEARTSRWLE